MFDRPMKGWQCDINRMGVPTEVVSSFKKCDGRVALQCVGRCEPRNAGANNGNAGWRARGHQLAEYKNVAKRPDANKGGREEENRSGISTETNLLRRLRNNETCMPMQAKAVDSMSAKLIAKFLRLPASVG